MTKTSFKLTLLERITFSGIPRETFDKGMILTGEIVRITSNYLIFLLMIVNAVIVFH